jgi:hypothetical protein
LTLRLVSLPYPSTSSRAATNSVSKSEAKLILDHLEGTESRGLKGDQVKRLKELEAENTRLRRAVSDLTLEKLILKEAASGNF